MRLTSILVLLAAFVAVPTATAIEQVVFEIPDANVHVDGTTFTPPPIAGAPVQAQGSVVVKDIDVSVSETRCSVPTGLTVKDYGQAADACDAGEVTTSTAPTQIVETDLQIVPAAAPAAAPEDAGTVGTAAAIVDAIPAADVKVLAVAAAAAGTSMLGLYALWRVLKWGGFAAFLPLYSHISDNEILDDPNRAGIYRLIQAEPGISTKDVADRLDLAWGTVTHHLGKLEKRRFVVSKKYGKYRRYFANGAGGSQDKDALAVLRLDRTGDVAALIQQQPGMTQKAVSQVLGVSSSTILWHVKRLEQVHLVRKVREGKLVRYYPGEGLGATLIPAVPVTAA